MNFLLEGFRFSIKNFKSFGNDSFDFLELRPINIIIGRNNSGKSSLVDAISLCLSKGKEYNSGNHDVLGNQFSVSICQNLTEDILRRVFHENTSGGEIGGNHWIYGKRFISKSVVVTFGPGWQAALSKEPPTAKELLEIPNNYQQQLARAVPFPFDGLRLIQVAAERDVRPEAWSAERAVSPNGQGVTNLVRAFINSDDLPRQEVEVALLEELNEIYRGDCEFTAITCRESKDQVWEIFLREDAKGDIRLSQSGSSLKSIFIILATLRLIPRIEKVNWSSVVLSLEEPENNLHPALLRRLLNFLAKRRKERNFCLIMSTHSPIGIDWSTRRDDTQIIHVKHDGASAYPKVAIGYGNGRAILDDLDIRASDILQANGVIWVEGPSDRIYLNKWIELQSIGTLKEGVHYSIMFYGGKLLSHLHGIAPGENDKLISLLALNRNVALLIDSDRNRGKAATPTTKARKPRMHLNATKRRLKQEFEASEGFIWITEGREVENYISPSALSRMTGGGEPPEVDLYDDVVALAQLDEFDGDKIAIAHCATEHLKVEDLAHLDLRQRLIDLCETISHWNNR